VRYFNHHYLAKTGAAYSLLQYMYTPKQHACIICNGSSYLYIVPKREVPELEIRERPSSTLGNVDGMPPSGC
jgi:hypothetical protein